MQQAVNYVPQRLQLRGQPARASLAAGHLRPDHYLNHEKRRRNPGSTPAGPIGEIEGKDISRALLALVSLMQGRNLSIGGQVDGDLTFRDAEHAACPPRLAGQDAPAQPPEAA